MGLGKTTGHALLRHLMLFACGSIGWILVYGARRGPWEVLQTLGAVSALAFPLLLLPPWARLASAAAILAGVEVFRPVFFPPLLGALGRNSPLAYMLSGLAILLLRAVIPGDAPAVLAWVSCFAVLAPLSIASLASGKLKIHVRP